MKHHLILATTVPETLATILKHQPRRLSLAFRIALVTSPGASLSAIALNEGVPAHQVRMARGIDPISDVCSLARMISLFLRTRPTLVHSYTPKAGLICMLSAWICRVPIRVHTFTGLVFPTEHGLKKKLLICIDRLICACATNVVPEGEGVANDLRQYRITSKPLQVIGHGNIAGVDTDFYSRGAPGVALAAVQLLQDRKIPDNAFLFCFIGRLNRDKGLDELVAAFARMPDHAYLLLGGALDHTAPVAAATLALIASNPRIHMLGFLEDVRPLLFASHIFVLPSYREGFPNVLLQAGAMGIPAIASDINGCNELLESGHNGWLVPVRDPKALADVMLITVEADAAAREAIGSRARARVADRFEQRDHWERMVRFYDGLLGARKPNG